MRSRIRLIELFGIALLVLVLAIVGSKVLVSGDDSADASVATPDPSPGGQVIGYDSVVDLLRASGLTVSPEGNLDQPFLSVSGHALTVNGENVQVFEYPDAASAKFDAAKISPDGSGTGTTMVDWISTPHFFQKDRLLVIHVGESSEVDAALRDILGPQFAGR